MSAGETFFVDVCIDNYFFPIRVASKPNYEGEVTIIKVCVKAKIDDKYEKDFSDNILGIVNDTENYIGLDQLSTKIIAYLNSIDALTAKIDYHYPYFVKRNFSSSGNSFVEKLICTYSFEITTLFKCKKRYRVEIPVNYSLVINKYFKTDIDVPIKIVVEIDGLDTIFVEDIIDVVDNILFTEQDEFRSKNINERFDNSYDYRINLMEMIKNDLFKKYNFYSSSVKIIEQRNQYLRHSKISRKENEPFDETVYEGEHIFI